MHRYNIIVSLFYVTYVIFEFPSNILLKKFSPSKHIGRIVIGFGVVTICTSAVYNYVGMLIIRIFLGIVEAGFYPGIVMYFAFWYDLLKIFYINVI